MKHNRLRTLIFWALCCDLGLFAKRLINPVANILTDALHIPGGIGTSFSLMFLIIAAALIPAFGCGCMMGAVQSALALGFGMVGSMGALSPIGYIVPGLVVDLMFRITKHTSLPQADRMVITNSVAAISAAMVSNCIVFHLSGIVLLLYICVSASSGAIFGLLGYRIAQRLAPVIKVEKRTHLNCAEQEVSVQ